MFNFCSEFRGCMNNRYCALHHVVVTNADTRHDIDTYLPVIFKKMELIECNYTCQRRRPDTPLIWSDSATYKGRNHLSPLLFLLYWNDFDFENLNLRFPYTNKVEFRLFLSICKLSFQGNKRKSWLARRWTLFIHKY